MLCACYRVHGRIIFERGNKSSEKYNMPRGRAINDGLQSLRVSSKPANVSRHGVAQNIFNGSLFVM